MDKIDFLQNTSCSPNKKLVEGCALGVSYMVVICDSDCGATTSLAYLNMSTGLTESTPPAEFVLGNCNDKTFKIGCIPYLETETFIPTAGQTTFTVANVPNGDVRFSRNGSTLDDAAATVSGAIVTYVPSANNGEPLLATDRIEISYVYAVCDVAVEPFVDCAGKEILNGAGLVTCAALDPTSFTVNPTSGLISVSGGGGGGTSQALTDCKGVVLPNGASVLGCDALDPDSFTVDPATGEITINNNVKGQGLTDCKGVLLPSGTSVLGCDALDPDNFVIDPATGEITINNNVKGQALTDCKGDVLASGTAVLSCDALDPNSFTIDPTTGEITITGGGGTSQALTDCKGTVLPNGSSVLACDALDPNTFVIDPATGEISLVGGKASVVTVADLITGHKIAKITVDGIAYTINETVTSLGTVTYDNVTGLLSIPYTDENGTLNTKTVTVAPTFVNTDGQQITGDNSGTVDLTLTAVVVGGVTNYTVKADLNVAATAQSGAENQLKWSASLNGYYVEPATGAETKVVAGTNVTVTGTGTTADPYVINAVTGAVTGIGQRWSFQGDCIQPTNTTGQNITIDGLFDLKVLETGATHMWIRPLSAAGMDIVAQWQGIKSATYSYSNILFSVAQNQWKEFLTTFDATGYPHGEFLYLYDTISDRAYEIRYMLTNVNFSTPYQKCLITVVRVR